MRALKDLRIILGHSVLSNDFSGRRDERADGVSGDFDRPPCPFSQ